MHPSHPGVINHLGEDEKNILKQVINITCSYLYLSVQLRLVHKRAEAENLLWPL